MYKNLSLEVIYIYILVNNYTKNDTKKNLNKLSEFFSLSSLFDIRTYFILRLIFINSYDLNHIKTILNDNSQDEYIKAVHIKKFKEVLLNFIKNNIGNIQINNAERKLNTVTNILNRYQNNTLSAFLLEICKYLEKEKHSFISYIIYCAIEEYLDLFIDADKILFNNRLIDKQFGVYFDLLHIKPHNVCFINKKNNIKIMQNFFPFEILCKIFYLMGNTELRNPNEQYFLIEYDSKLVSKKTPELLLHETGHMLNLKIYNFQEIIFHQLYLKDNTVNIIILDSWLNEIIADIIANNICENYINVFNTIEDNYECINYPPAMFRKAILENSAYDVSLFKDKEAKQVSMLIYNNLNLVKNLISLN